MRKLLIVLLIISSCRSGMESKIKTAVEEHLKKTMYNAKSYEPVDWGKIDKVYERFSKTEIADSLSSKLSDYNSEAQNRLDEIQKLMSEERYETSFITRKLLLDKAEILQHESDSIIVFAKMTSQEINKQMSIFDKKSDKKVTGYSVLHSFRGTNAMGGLILKSFMFELDTNFIVTNYYDTEKQ